MLIVKPLELLLTFSECNFRSGFCFCSHPAVAARRRRIFKNNRFHFFEKKVGKCSFVDQAVGMKLQSGLKWHTFQMLDTHKKMKTIFNVFLLSEKGKKIETDI
jgi:hypothetical protein